jgi:hypothetical protein
MRANRAAGLKPPSKHKIKNNKKGDFPGRCVANNIMFTIFVTQF